MDNNSDVHVSLDNGTLRIVDVGAASNESLSITTNGGDLIITDINQTLSGSGTGVDGSGTNSIRVPIASITGGVDIDTGEGTDSVLVAGITLSGMDSTALQVSGVETLQVFDSTFAANTGVRGAGSGSMVETRSSMDLHFKTTRPLDLRRQTAAAESTLMGRPLRFREHNHCRKPCNRRPVRVAVF
ncbi:MAG: hypothetical protein R3C05_16510 [Pirellulaceae bacterium]